MAPTIYDGDVLLVDVGVPEITVAGVYALWARDQIHIKRARRTLDGRLIVSADSPTDKLVEEIPAGQQIDVLGPVLAAIRVHRI